MSRPMPRNWLPARRLLLVPVDTGGHREAALDRTGATPADAVALVLRIDRMRSRRHHRMLRALLRLPDGNGRDDPFGLHLRPVTDALILDWQGSPHLMEINARDGETGHASGDA
ncbi:hypothetical protein [Burkholderia anthina]|uniref:hypothetical protein n=1 Tax=Burkholderia anthina TaxID=179879 RepID=UPI001AA0770B|nr:hypothetical protein [Burkholderia anthina]QTD94704.1 hypothetical protein J4G50_36800 [Burkholderia anthina]